MSDDESSESSPDSLGSPDARAPSGPSLFTASAASSSGGYPGTAGAGESSSASGAPVAAKDLWRKARRLIGTISQAASSVAGPLTASTEAADGSPSGDSASAEPPLASTNPSTPASDAVVEVQNARRGSFGVPTWENIVDEARRPFGHLLTETPSVEQLMQGTSGDPGEVFQAFVRDRLIGRIIDCCAAVVSELTSDEATLWNSFVQEDRALRGLLYVEDAPLRRVLQALEPATPELLDDWLRSLRSWVGDAAEIDFADLVDWYAHEEQQRERMGGAWTAGVSSLRSTVQQFSRLIIGGELAQAAPPRMSEECLGELRVRCVQAEPLRLAEAAVAYQKSMVLTACWRCEKKIRGIIMPILSGESAVAHGDAAGARRASLGGAPAREGPQRRSLLGLLSVLRAINSELAPSERVLWESLVTSSHAFEGCFSKEEVLAALGSLSSTQLSDSSSSAANGDLEDLRQLRTSCHQRSVDQLFDDCYEDTGSNKVTLANVLRWFWDMPEDYRFAAGLCAPMALLQRSLRRQPEEMFSGSLRTLAAHPPSTCSALLGHVHVYADLQALSTRRVVEALRSGVPTCTRTTTTSDAGTEVDLEDDATMQPLDDDAADAASRATDANATSGQREKT